MSARDFCTMSVVTAEKDATLQEIANQMREANVGSVIVVERVRNGFAKPVGIVTDRDIALQLGLDGKNAANLEVGDLVEGPFYTMQEDDGIFEVLRFMDEKGISRVPLVDEDGILTGIISCDDAIELIAAELNQVARLKQRQQAGYSPRSAKKKLSNNVLKRRTKPRRKKTRGPSAIMDMQ